MELMIAVAIIGILTAVAVPMYSDYVLRGQLTEAFSKLPGMQLSLEQYYQDNRSYSDNTGACGTQNPSGSYFTYSCSAPTAQSYTVTATGISGTSTAGFTYTLDQSSAKSTTAAPSAWAAASMPASCWIRTKGGVC